MADNRFKYLAQINSPEDLRKFSKEELEKVCQDLRCYIIDEVSENPGHFGASLGVVELTVALHYAYNTPFDKLVWDVGHQAYSHKILTGRRDQFKTNRKYKGISGFPNISESEYDSFGVGHSSTSISAGLGMATKFKLAGEKNKVVAVIGDGALTGGMAFEALNNLSSTNPDILIILNDNSMSIDQPVGGLHQYLVRITTSATYNRIKRKVWNGLGKFWHLGRKTRSTVQKIEQSTKSFIFKESNFFEALDIRYFGPVDGHDVEGLTTLFERLKKIPGPKLLHVITKKGKGFTPAENNQTKFHAPGKFDKLTGEILTKTNGNEPPLYQKAFGETLLELALQNEKIVGITPAMLSGSSLNIMKEQLPNRVFDVGIAEQHAATFAAGLAVSGYKPFCNIYSSFAQRAYDQIIHDIALQNLNVVLCLDRSGIVGADGATHHGVFDLAYLRPIPNLTILSPMNEVELRNMMYTAQLKDFGAVVIRYPRGKGVVVDWKQPFEEVDFTRGRKIKDGESMAILTIGHTGNFAQEAINSFPDTDQIAHYDMRCLKPIDEDLLHSVFQKYEYIITVEDGILKGGLGSAVTEFMNQYNYNSKIITLGVPDRFIDHGTPSELYKECNFDVESIQKVIKKLLVTVC